MRKQYTFLLISISLFISCAKDKGNILFSSNRNGNSDIYIMDFDGKNQMPLTQTAFEEWSPTWINKNEISFLRQNNDSIFRVKLNLKTMKESRLKHPTNCLLDDKNVLYSDGLEIYTCEGDIFLYRLTTNETLNITHEIGGSANYPSLSNDGKYVIFTSNHLGKNQIFEYEVDSKSIRQLTNSNSNNERGDLSSNKKLLAYSSDYFEKGNQEIVIKNLENGELKNISKSSGMELIARFSKDGKNLYFGTNKDGNWEIYSYDLETENKIRLTHNNKFDGDPRILKNK
ncbi:TolB family protein [Hanstruepera marina]|uniref:TolB family protein n=1 Tax=Hanstruepera marina TaxID=2873265 RepID=UPI001CA63297|nr:hypothetical protein [Hanstruepera marina]